MSWQDIHGHDRIVEQFRRALERGRLASSFLFAGPSGIGKHTFALKFAQAMLCDTNADSKLDPCGSCASCQQVTANSHPDLLLISKPPDKSAIPLKLFIGTKEHRMREGLCHDIALKPSRGGRKIAIIDDADHLNKEGANCLLKTLEEPPSKSVIFLICTSQQKQLPTIRSRCQIVRFQPLEESIVAELLVSLQCVDRPADAQSLAALSQGSVRQAMRLAEGELLQFRRQFLDRLGEGERGFFDFTKELIALVDEAGKDAPPRRERMRLVIGMALDFYRQWMRNQAGAPIQGDDDLRQAVLAAGASSPADAGIASESLQRCLDALAHIDANANQATLLECWLDDLDEIAQRGHLLSSYTHPNLK